MRTLGMIGPSTAVVFVHGYLCVSPALYWMGLRPLRRALAERGVPALVSRTPRTASVEARGRCLADVLDRLPHRRLILVGHSMGGLDARRVASRYDPRRRINHVVTVGTPHRGSRLAEWALGDSRLRARLLRFVDRGALRDLTPEGAARLDAEMPDRLDVTYIAMAGSLPPASLPALFRRFGERLALAEGENDGLVPLRSARRGTGPAALAADHLGLIGAAVGPGDWPGQIRRAGLAVAALTGLIEGIVGHADP